MKRSSNAIVLVILAIAAVLGGIGIYFYSQQLNVAGIYDFESCAAAGYPIMESYPEQCATPDGRSFTRDISGNSGGSTSSPAGGNQAIPEPTNGVPVTISGTLVCLPHKNTDQPQTLECAYGLETDEGIYYALQDSDPTYANLMRPMNERMTIVGLLTPQAETKYQSQGLIYVKTVSPAN